MTWNNFIYFAYPTLLCWGVSGVLINLRKYRKLALLLMSLGLLIFFSFIIGLWIGQNRPPLRTMGETRLWYSFFLSAIGLLTYYRWRYSWLLTFSSLVASIFIGINILKPEIHSANLMPALQSYWFIPHVTVYILSYAMLGAATIAASIKLYKINKGETEQGLLLFIDNLIYIGFGFLMLGLLMGALWAKEAWGHYWSWDPKETWAFITCAAYLIYIHMRLRNSHLKTTLWLLPLAFILLLITWIGVNYLPSAQTSIHTYS